MVRNDHLGDEPAPLQSRAQFLKNWSWSSVAQINGGLCERSKAQQGVNSETHAAVAQEWEARRTSELTLLETFQFLKSCHRRAPFLFFNGNTFAEIGRALANALFSDLPLPRRKETSSAVAHFITGVLDQEMMVAAVQSLGKVASFAVLALMLMFLMMAGCGGHATPVPPTGIPGTPVGTSTVTVTATSGAIIHTTTFSLTVN